MNFQETKKFIEENSEYVLQISEICKLIFFLFALIFVVFYSIMFHRIEVLPIVRDLMKAVLYALGLLITVLLFLIKLKDFEFTKKDMVNSDVLDIFNQIDIVIDGEYKDKLIYFFDAQNFDFLDREKDYKNIAFIFDVLKEKLRNADPNEATAIADYFTKINSIKINNKRTYNQNI